ncbi:MAG: hypothetical protein U9N61_11540 [Euryarchaeota archaeon]|nr:hypothetical protein [Euryarchaeota archaeon]
MIKLSHRAGYERPADCNGCGSGWSTKVVPDTIYLLDISDVCCIHDDRYEHGTTIADKEEGDREFLNNLLRKIDANDSWYYPTKLARIRAVDYYSAVKDYGGPAFWDGKEQK